MGLDDRGSFGGLIPALLKRCDIGATPLCRLRPAVTCFTRSTALHPSTTRNLHCGD